MMNNELYHHGVEGQKWGVKNGPPYPLGSGMSPRKAQSRAKKDAKEYARAKMFYGEGAGTRRKLIKNIVNERSKDPVYKQAFDEALSRQDMAKHAEKAKSERHRKDAANTVAKTGRGLANIISGHPERAGAALVATTTVVGLTAAVAHKTGVDKVIANAAKQKVNDIRNAAATAKARRWLKNKVFVVRE